MIGPMLMSLWLAVGQPDEAGARRLFEQASAAYEQNDFAAAIELFEAAYARAPRPQIAFSLAQAYRRQGTSEVDPERSRTSIRRAIKCYRQYIDLSPRGSRRPHAEQFISQLEQLLSFAERSSTSAPRTELIVMSNVASGRVSVDGTEVSLMAPIEVTPGSHVVAVEAPGYFPYRNEANIPEGRTITIDAELRARPGLIRFNAPEGAEVALDGRLQGAAPFPVPLEVSAGRHLVTISDRGVYPYVRELDVGIGEEVLVEAQLERTTQRTISYVIMGAAGALAVGSIVMAGLAFDTQQDAQEIRDVRDRGDSLTVAEADRHNLLIRRRDDFVGISIGVGTAGLVAAATSLLLYFVDSPRSLLRAPEELGE